MRSFFLLLLTLLLLASCSTIKNFSLEKRQYRPGYFVDLGREHHVHAGPLSVDPGIKQDEIKKIPTGINGVPSPEQEHALKNSLALKTSFLPTLTQPQPIAPLPTDSNDPGPVKKKGIGLPGLAIAGSFMGDAGLALGYFTSFMMPWVIVAISLFFLGLIFIMIGMHLHSHGPHDSCTGILALLCMAFIPVYVIGYIIYKAIKSSVSRHHNS